MRPRRLRPAQEASRAAEDDLKEATEEANAAEETRQEEVLDGIVQLLETAMDKTKS